MTEKMYSVEEVADRLGLHVRTVRGYIRSGRLGAVRIGKQYRIARAALDAFTAHAEPQPSAPPRVEVSSIVQVEDVDRAAADRLGTFVLASVNTGAGDPLRVQVVHDEERSRMKIVLLGGAAATADILHLLDAVLAGGLLTGREDGGG
ncbi:helix-turn-helix domain-containing protein [Actinomadura litoris]|uniref:helix-turn-helix domain-containing protein n=1 Tax=Actinomadura litoris TaxID=2678616 RepID=UPI001FA81942|nr:helix-turn-helix domain-containing protein [Actinomadura litoris]